MCIDERDRIRISVDISKKRYYNKAMNEKTLTCTGHRPKGFGWDYYDKTCDEHKKYLNELRKLVGEFVEQGYTRFISGGALGADCDFAETVLLYKEVKPDIVLEIAVPCANQARAFSPADKKRYDTILARVDEVNVLSEHYTRWCMHARNRYMVDKSDAVIAIWNGKQEGGTFSTLTYAQKKQKKVVVLDICACEKNI